MFNSEIKLSEINKKIAYSCLRWTGCGLKQISFLNLDAKKIICDICNFSF